MSENSHIKVMIVEDQPSFQELVHLVLSLDSQFEIVYTAGTGEEGLENVKDANPDLVLVDFRLPGIDGLETAKRMKEQIPGIKIAMVTAHTEEVLARLAKEAAILEVIPKSTFSLEHVRKLVDRYW